MKHTKKLLWMTSSLMLSFLLIGFAFFTNSFFSANAAGGTGTPGDPYVIADCTELQDISLELDASYILSDDINCVGVADWTPIGTFTGTLDGNEKTISNITNDGSREYNGLFSIIYGGTVTNLTITDIDLQPEGWDFVGGLAGEVQSDEDHPSTIDNVHTSGTIYGGWDTGGLIGKVSGEFASIINSSSSVTVNGWGEVGGLIGFSESPISTCFATGNVIGMDTDIGGLVGLTTNAVSYSNATGAVSGIDAVGGLIGSQTESGLTSVTNSYATGNVTGGRVAEEPDIEAAGNSTGGLIGYSRGAVANSYATGDVINLNPGSNDGFGIGGLIGTSEENTTIDKCYATGSVTGHFSSGGLIGTINNTPTITQSYATGVVEGDIRVGGFVGTGGASTISNSYAMGNVTGTDEVGGFAGGWGWNAPTISNSYSTGAVVGSTDVGGFVGNWVDGTISNSYYDTQTSGQSDDVGKGVPKSTLQMKDYETFEDWNFITIWEVDGVTNSGYPFNYDPPIPSHIATVTSSDYVITSTGSTTGTITDVSFGTSKEDFLTALVKRNDGQTWEDSDISDPVVSGNTLVVTAEDGITVVTYTVTVNEAIISNIATVTSATYTVTSTGDTTGTISDILDSTEKATFLGNLTKGNINQTWEDLDISDPVVSGDTLVVTAEDGITVVTYTVVVSGIFANLNAPAVVSNSTTFELTGTASYSSPILSVQFRNFVLGQLENENWNDCTLGAGTVEREFSCDITGLDQESKYPYEIRLSFSEPVEYIPPNKWGNVDIMRYDGSDILAWWPFGVSENLIDSSGNNHTGTLTGSTSIGFSFASGSKTNIFDTATTFQVADTQKDFNFVGTEKEFTADFWLYPTTFTEADILYKYNNDNSGYVWKISMGYDGRLFGQINSENRGNLLIGESGTNNFLNLDEWNHVIFSYSNIDQAATIKMNDNAPETTFLDTKLVLESSDKNVGIGLNFSGEIDDIKIFNSADTRAPDISFSSLTNPERVTNANQPFTLTVTDETGVSSLEYLFSELEWGESLNLEPWVQITDPTIGDWGDKNLIFDISAPNLDDGNWYLYVRATDTNLMTHFYTNFGWYSAVYNITPSAMPYLRFTVEAKDTTPPLIYANAIIPNPTSDKSPGVRGYIKDYEQLGTGDTSSNIANIQYRLLNNEIWSDWLDITPLSGGYDSMMEEIYFKLEDLVAGDYTLEIRAIDVAGNSTEDNSTNYLESFTILSEPVVTHEVAIIEEEETFTTHSLHDVFFSDGVWGNGILRLRQKIDFTRETAKFTGSDAFSFKFGFSNIGVYDSLDGNMWVALNNKAFAYYNPSTNNYVTYPVLINAFIENIKEINHNGARYLLVAYDNDVLVYNINNTPENISDDPPFSDYALDSKEEYSQYAGFSIIGTDTRNGKFAYYAILKDGHTNFVVWIDTKNTVMDLSDDDFTVWNAADELLDKGGGLGYVDSNDFTGAYFDQGTNTLVLASYHWSVWECSDNGTPSIKTDDFCKDRYGPENQAMYVFSILKDPHGYYWLGGNEGIFRIDTKGTADFYDDTLSQIVTASDIGGQNISQIRWVVGEYPVGDELWYLTRSGYIKALEFNYTYNDVLDDTYYTYKIENLDNRSGGSSTFVMPNKNEVYVPVQGFGLQKISLSRSFENTNTIELLPVSPDGILAVNYVDLEEVLGSVSSGSHFTLNELVSYEVSNDAGVTWYPITEGARVEFPTPDYKLKLRILLNKGSSPIIDFIKMSYVTYPSKEENQCDIKINQLAPTIKSLTPLGTGSIKVKFDKIENEPLIQNYVLEYGLSNSVFQFAPISVSKSASSYTVSGLSLDTKYFFRIRAVTGCTTSDWSNVLSAKDTGSPYQPPTVYVPPVVVPPDDVTVPIDDIIVPPDDVVVPPQDGTAPITETGDLKGISLVEIFQNIVSNVTEAIQKIGHSIKALPISEKIVQDITATSFALIAVTSAISVGIGNTVIWAYILRTSSVIFVFFGLGKRKRNCGLIYNSVTKEPLSNVVVRIYNSKETLVATEVSNSYGIFETDIPSGQYSIVVKANNYRFPSMLITDIQDSPYENIYRGGSFNYDSSSTINYSIPVDPLDKSLLEYAGTIASTKLINFSTFMINLLMLVGLVFSIISYIKVNSTLNLIFLLVYIVLIALGLLIKKQDRYRFGTVKNYDGAPVEGMELGLLETEFNRIYAKRITNEEGKYRFIVPGGEYRIVSLDPRYQLESGGNLTINNKSKKMIAICKNLKI